MPFFTKARAKKNVLKRPHEKRFIHRKINFPLNESSPILSQEFMTFYHLSAAKLPVSVSVSGPCGCSVCKTDLSLVVCYADLVQFCIELQDF